MTARRTPFADLPAPQQAGILCNDPQFRRFVSRAMGTGEDPATATAAAEYLRHTCQVTSRRELTANHDARARFDTLRTEFEAWAGRIAAPGAHPPATEKEVSRCPTEP